MRLVQIWIALLKREWILTWRNRIDVLIALLFFLAVASLFPLAMNPNPQLLRQMGIAVILTNALLANLLTLDKLFASDYRDGSLVRLMLLPIPLTMTVSAKIIIHYLSTGVALAVISPLIALQYQMDIIESMRIVAVLLTIMPALSSIGALTAALTLGLDASKLLPALLHLPLCVPILIFSGMAMDSGNISGNGVWLVLMAILLLTCFFLPMLTASVLKWIHE